MSHNKRSRSLWKAAGAVADDELLEQAAAAQAAPELVPQEERDVDDLHKKFNTLKHPPSKLTIPPTEENPLDRVPQREGKRSLTEEQEEAIFAEIEELLFLGGRHREDVVSYLRKHYQIRRTTAEYWIRRAETQWRAAQAQINLTDRHYQLERMAHALYNRAAEGPSWTDIKRHINKVQKLIDEKKFDEVSTYIAQMKKIKGGDLRVAQRILWNLCMMSGYGTRITLDLGGANLGGEDSN